MKKSASLALSFAAFSVAALCAGCLAYKRGLLHRKPAAESAAEVTLSDEASAPQEPAKKTFRDGQLHSDSPVPEDAPADLSPIFEFQLVESEEIRA